MNNANARKFARQIDEKLLNSIKSGVPQPLLKCPNCDIPVAVYFDFNVSMNKVHLSVNPAVVKANQELLERMK